LFPLDIVINEVQI